VSHAPRVPLTGEDVHAAAAYSTELLHSARHRDWSLPVPGLDFTVASVVAHAAQGPLWYALDIWGGPHDDAAFSVGVRADVPNDWLVVSVRSAASACAASVDAAPAGTRGFHPYGSPDPEGFAAMACDELLVHTHDAARALSLDFAPDEDLAARVVARLFPWHDAGAHPWQALLWANGRIELPGHPVQQAWRWHSAPLSEWDGRAPSP
jgi:hypothetical protein